MSVTISIDNDTTDRELAAIACLIAVLRSDQQVPAPPVISFDHADSEAPAPAPAAAAVPPVAADIPPPPPAPAVPPVPTPASEALIQQEAARAAQPAGELDVNGIPWDERIHAGTKVKNGDGSWRNKRGADPALIASVTAELKAAQPAADVPPPPSEPAPATAADAATAFGAAGAGNASDAASADVPPPPADAAPPPPSELQQRMAAVAADAGGGAAPPPPATEGPTFPDVLSRAGAAGLDYETLTALAGEFGLAKFQDLTGRPELLALFSQRMEAKILELAPAADA